MTNKHTHTHIHTHTHTQTHMITDEIHDDAGWQLLHTLQTQDIQLVVSVCM